MSEYSQKSYDLYEQMGPLLNNLTSINNQFEHQKKQISNLTYTVDKLHLQTKNRDIDQKNLQWLYSLQERENKLALEIQQNESKKAYIEQLKEQNLFFQQQIENLNQDNQKLRLQLQQSLAKNENLVSQSEISLKQSIKDVNEQFISRITQLEAQLQNKQRDEQNIVIQIAQMTNKIKVLEQQKFILQEECDKFELIKETLIKEKEMYLNEFRYLKENYFKTIDSLQDEVHKLKIQNHSLSEDNKSLKQTCDYYKQKFQDLLDLQELATLNNDHSLLALLKQKGMENITKNDLEQVREEVIQDMTMRKQFQLDDVWDKVINDINNLNI